MRILWSSNAFWAATGYGVQAQYLLPRLQALGHTVAQHAWYGLHGGMMETNGIPIYPGYDDPYGNDVAAAHAKHFRADAIISLIDIWVLHPDAIKRATHLWIPWFPIDHAPVAETIIEKARQADYPVTYSLDGQQQLARRGLDVAYIPHGVDTDLFTPGDRAEARGHLGLPEDAYVVTMVAANKGYPSRKAFPEQLRAFAAFRQQHPDALLYLHTRRHSPDGLEMDALLRALDIPTVAVRYADQYRLSIGLPASYMVDVYRATDVVLGATMGEGFGIPLVEAQACGTPVITTRCTSMTELTINGIATEPAQPFWIPAPLQSWQMLPSVGQITAALAEVYAWSPAHREAKAALGVQVMRERYAWDVVVEQGWGPFLERVEYERAERAARAYVQVQESLAERDRAMPRGDVDTWYNGHRFELAEDCLERLRLPIGAYVTEIGCAEGALLWRWWARQWHVTAIDIAPSRIAWAMGAVQRKLPKGFRRDCLVADATTWEALEPQDAIVALELIEHVADADALLRNCYANLRPGGWLLLSTPNDPAGTMVDGVEHVRAYTLADLEAALTAAGFRCEDLASTVPGLYGPDGLLNHPERLAEYQARARARDWPAPEGSNWYIVARRPRDAT